MKTCVSMSCPFMGYCKEYNFLVDREAGCKVQDIFLQQAKKLEKQRKAEKKRVKYMNKVFNAIMGLVVGDALGVPFEFKKRDTFKCTDMVGYGTYNMPPGTWSDDSSLTLATLESISRLGKIDLDDIMGNFWNWYSDAKFTPHGEVFDVGSGTKRALERYGQGLDPLDCGGKAETDNGNGSLMRILPLAFTPSSINDINNVSSLTHAHATSLRACRLYIIIAENLLKGKLPYLAVSEKDIYVEEFSRIPELWKLNRDEIRSTGYVVDTLEAALWCLLHTDTYRDCVLTAVNLGDDTDTVAAVAGGLAGIVYGRGGKAGIPEKWIKQIPGADWIWEMCVQVDSR